MEFPAVSQTRYEFWKEAQYTQSGMWWFTLCFGFFGLHHLLLRSPQTAIIFFIANILLLGYPWFYDLIQLSSKGGLNTEGLNQFGLGYAGGSLGLARGMWIDPNANANANAQGKAPSPWWFLLYCLTLPIAVIANLIAGDQYNALARFICYTILPFGSFITTCALFYDYFILLFRPDDLLINGSKRFFPFTVLGMDADGHSPGLTGVRGIASAPCSKDGFLVTIMKMIGSLIASVMKMLLTVGMIIAPEFVLPLEFAFIEASSVVDDGIFLARDAVKLGQEVVGSAVQIGTQSLKGAAEVAGAGVKLASDVAVLSAAVPKTAIGSLEQTAQQISQIHVPSPQLGGGSASATTLDWFAGGSILALIAGGMIMAAKG